MQIRIIPLGPLQTNGFLLSDNGKAVFIDPGDDPAKVLELIKSEGLELTHVLITHIHLDHFYGATRLADETGAEVLVYEKDAFLIEEEVRNGWEMGYPELEKEFTYTPLELGEQEFLGCKCVVLSTPGHTPGSVTFHFPDEGVAFVGDLIFARSVGRTDYTGGNTQDLMNSIRTHIFTMPEETVLLPGHGPATKAGEEKEHNPFFK